MAGFNSKKHKLPKWTQEEIENKFQIELWN